MSIAKQIRLVASALKPIIGRGTITRHSYSNWASITFKGERHNLTVAYDGGAISDGEAFVTVLPDHEFALPGHIVADAAVQFVTSTDAGLTAVVELLLVEEER